MQCLWLAQLSYGSFVNQSDPCCVLGYFCLYGMCHMFRSARGTHERVLIPIQQFLLEPRRPFCWHKSISKDPLFSASFCHLRPGPYCLTDQHKVAAQSWMRGLLICWMYTFLQHYNFMILYIFAFMKCSWLTLQQISSKNIY